MYFPLALALSVIIKQRQEHEINVYLKNVNGSVGHDHKGGTHTLNLGDEPTGSLGIPGNVIVT
jgi:hypothetical protein